MSKIKEAKYIKAIVEGKTKQQAGLAAGAKSPVAASKYALRMSKKVSVQLQIEKALYKNGITIEAAIAPISDALQANKSTFDKEIGDFVESDTPDHNTRLSASKMALELLGAKNPPQQEKKDDNTIKNKELAQALQESDEIELNRIVFNKKTTQSETIEQRPPTPN